MAKIRCFKCKVAPLEKGWRVKAGNIYTPSCRVCSCIYGEYIDIPERNKADSFMTRVDGKKWFEKRNSGGEILVDLKNKKL